MANIKTAKFTLTDMEDSRSLGDRLQDRWITVKDFGAVGDGTADDTAEIQAAFDYAFGTFADPNADADSDLNKVVFFPRGRYKISAPLVINAARSPILLGAGSHQSRIFWDPEGDPVESDNMEGGFYPVIEFLGCYHVTMEGLTFDASEVQSHVIHCGESPVQADDGHDGHYRDIHLTGAANIGGAGFGIVFSGDAMGSERFWTKCRFTNCAVSAYFINHGNALNHWFFGCYFADSAKGIEQVGQGGSITLDCCRFANNTTFDIKTQAGAVLAQGCSSTSQHFANTQGMVIACTHENVSAGLFLTDTGTDVATTMLLGNRSTNGTIMTIAPGDTRNGLHLMGNDFQLSTYADALLAAVPDRELMVDGVRLSP